jgi:hypothetical protein
VADRNAAIETQQQKKDIRMTYFTSTLLGSLVASALFLGSPCIGADFDIRKPTLDKDGRFWLYKNVQPGDALPFVPYAWMPAQAGEMMTMDVTSKANPHVEGEKSASETCIAVTVKWSTPYWCGAAFLSGPDTPPPGWWGEDDRGWHFDLRGLKSRKLVFYAKGATGQERMQVKFGILGDKRYGDSLPFPKESRWLKLSKNWTKYELDLSALPPAQLQRICNAFTFVLNREQQEGSSREQTTFCLDDIYLE